MQLGVETLRPPSVFLRRVVVAMIDRPIHVMLTHMPQERPWAKVPVGNATKVGVAVLGQRSIKLASDGAEARGRHDQKPKHNDAEWCQM